MFAYTVNALLSGSVICPVTDPDAYHFLEDEQNLRKVAAFLENIDRTVASPSAGQSFFLVYGRGVEAPRAQIRDIHKQIMGEVQPMIEFVELVLHARNSDVMLQPEDLIEVNAIIGAIAGSETLRVELSSLVSSLALRADGTDRGRFTAVIARLEKWKYLVLADGEREIYRVTGKINLFRDLLDILIEAMPGVEEEIEKELAQRDFF